MSEMWGIPSPYKSGPKTTFFRRPRNLTATLTTYRLSSDDIDNRASALQTQTTIQGVSYMSQNDMNFGPQMD